MFTPALLSLLCCPLDRAALEQGDGFLRCTVCGTIYNIHNGYAELLTSTAYAHSTQYLENEGGEILDYRDFGQPLLSAQVKNNLLNAYLQFKPTDIVLDLGCGNGKFAYWNRSKRIERGQWVLPGLPGKRMVEKPVYILTGSMVVENIFTIGGLGSQFVSSITSRDYTLIMGTTIFLAVLMVVANLLTDIVYTLVDPRIRLE